MALPVYSSLLYPTIAIKSGSVYGDQWISINGINVINTPFMPDASNRYLFGVVNGVNYLSTKVSVGQSVMFDAGKAVLVTQGGVQTFLADENLVILTENPPV